jgi:DNA-binding MarR family transcriptional regulator
MAAEEIAEQLHSAAIHLLRGLRRADEASGLNGPRLSALSVIVFGGPISLGQLAAAERVRPPTMTRMVNALEGLGLVDKKASDEDRRSILIFATMRGRRLLVKGRERRTRALAQQIADLDAAEQAVLQNAINVIRKVTQTG